MHTLVLTAAGRSTRYPDTRPKWSLTHPSGDIMAVEAIKKTTGYHRLIVAMNTDDLGKYGVDNVRQEFELGLDRRTEIINVGNTKTQTETLHRALMLGEVSDSFTVRECDNAFTYCCQNENLVSTVDLQEYQFPVIAKNKSYVECSAFGRINALREKRVASQYFCCGAYSMRVSDWDYMYGKQSFISEVIHDLVKNGTHFEARRVLDYVDWGTQEDWDRYCAEFVTLFVDIDGVLVESSHRSFHPRWCETNVIQENVDALNSLKNAYVILTTSRPEGHRLHTEIQLNGVRYDRLIMGLPVCRRVLINDRTRHDTASAINLIRNSKDLEKLL